MFSGVKNTFTAALGTVTDVVHDAATLVIGETDIEDSLVDAPTPHDERWFTPKDGWPKAVPGVKKWRAPPSLMPTAENLPDHFHDQNVVGELRLEVLSCENLPKLMQIGRSDPYCAVVFEKYAARTSAVHNDHSPEWSKDHPRAFKFPIECPYSVIFAAIMDEDEVSWDDPIGRVVIEVGRLCANTVYDSTFALQYGPFSKHKGKRGLIRLRYSITFNSERARVLGYLKYPMPRFYVPFLDDDQRLTTAFAYRGRFKPHAFKYSLFQAHVQELTELAKGFGQKFREFIFYEAPILNLFYLTLYQLMITRLWLLPACIPLGLVGSLVTNYWFRVRAPRRIHRQPQLLDLVSSAVLATNEPPLDTVKRPSPRAAGAEEEVEEEEEEEEEGEEESSASEGESDDEDDSKKKKPTEDKEAREEKKPAEEDGGRRSSADKAFSIMARATDRLGDVYGGVFGARPSLDEEIEEMKAEIEEELEKEMEDIDVKRAKKALRGVNRFNPMAKLLGPYQIKLGRLLVYLRCVKYILLWSDRVLSLLLTLALSILTVLLAFAGWGVSLLLDLVPWALVFEWTFRLLGAALLGPHMYLVGRQYEKKQAEWRDECRDYAQASDDAAEAILEKHRERITREMRAAWGVDDEAEKQNELDPALAKYSAPSAAAPTSGGSVRFSTAPSAAPVDGFHASNQERRTLIKTRSKSYARLKTDGAEFVLSSQPDPLIAAGGGKFRCKPKAMKSKAYPLVASPTPARAAEKEEGAGGADVEA